MSKCQFLSEILLHAGALAPCGCRANLGGANHRGANREWNRGTLLWGASSWFAGSWFAGSPSECWSQCRKVKELTKRKEKLLVDMTSMGAEEASVRISVAHLPVFGVPIYIQLTVYPTQLKTNKNEK